MNFLVAIVMFLNLLFAVREFFAVWDHITLTKNQDRIPDPEDCFELVLTGVLISITFFTFCTVCFR